MVSSHISVGIAGFNLFAKAKTAMIDELFQAAAAIP